MLISANNK